MRYVCIDLGEKRTGIAAGDAETRVVTPVEVIEVAKSVRGGEALVEAIARAVESHLGRGAGALVFGLPLNMDGSEGPAAKGVRAFAALVGARTGRAVHFQDERLTSAEAEWTLARSGLTRGEKKERRDALAAAAILRDFLAGLGGMPTP